MCICACCVIRSMWAMSSIPTRQLLQKLDYSFIVVQSLPRAYMKVKRVARVYPYFHVKKMPELAYFAIAKTMQEIPNS